MAKNRLLLLWQVITVLWFGIQRASATCNATTVKNTAADVKDEVPRYFAGTVGKGNADNIEPDAPVFSGKENHMMITEVRIVYFLQNGVKHIKCFDFTYGDAENHCPETSYAGRQVDTIVLDRDEYIIEISGHNYQAINKLALKTNKRNIGPYGVTDFKDTEGDFVIKHDGAPLLYADIKMGVWLYEMSFTFLAYKVSDLKQITDKVAQETFEIMTSTITDIYKVKLRYQNMLFDAARKGCYPFEVKQTPEALTACNLHAIMQQVLILSSSTSAYCLHQDRDLTAMRDYDSQDFLRQVDQSKAFHDLTVTLRFDIKTVIDVTHEQSSQLNNYFKSQADFDQKMASANVVKKRNFLISTKKGAADSAEVVGKKLQNVIGVGLGVVIADAAEAAANLALVIAENCNPFKWLFGGPDIDKIYEATENLMKAIRNVAKMSYLQDHLSEYMNLATEISRKLESNFKAIEALSDLVDSFITINDTNEIMKLAEDYTQAYGSMSLEVTSQEIVYMSTILSGVATQACTIVGNAHGMFTDAMAMIYESIANDCLYLPADLAVLSSYYQTAYSVQYDFINVLTQLARASIASHMADNIGEIGATIDVSQATIGSAMVQIQYQSAAQQRCDILEYTDGGKRPEVCERILFTQTDINQLISYTGAISKQTYSTYAFHPTMFMNDTHSPFINLTKLLRGGYESLQLPINNTKWLHTYDWLPGSYDEETAFYFEFFEPYIPGLRCNESDDMPCEIYIRLLSSKPQSLYKEASEPTYTIYEQLVLYSYTYNTDHCPGDIVSYPVKKNDMRDIPPGDTVCVKQRGIVGDSTRKDFAFPSLYNMWIMEISSNPGCTLVVNPDNNNLPMITFLLKSKQVTVKTTSSQKGINECWPDGSRCPPEEVCEDKTLGFSCKKYNYRGLLEEIARKAKLRVESQDI